MFVLIKLNVDHSKILECALSKREVDADPTNHLFVYSTDENDKINKLLNDYEKLTPVVSGSSITINGFGSASENPSARKIADIDWKYRVRPAFMRAATTTSAFNL